LLNSETLSSLLETGFAMQCKFDNQVKPWHVLANNITIASEYSCELSNQSAEFALLSQQWQNWLFVVSFLEHRTVTVASVSNYSDA